MTIFITTYLSLGAELEQPDALQNTLLHRMVVNNNPEAVSWLLEQKTVLESYNSEGNTPLLLSVIHNNKELVEFLLKKGADPKVKKYKTTNSCFNSFAKSK